jgi:hypothetical protein
MTKSDLNNLKFLLTADKETLSTWYNSASDSDLIYAMCLFDCYEQYLKTEADFIKIEQALADMPVFLEAQAVIAAVR